MVRKKSITALERDIKLDKAVLAVKSNQYKSVYAAAKALGLLDRSLQRRINGAIHSQKRVRNSNTFQKIKSRLS